MRAIVFVLLLAASAAEPFYVGKWKIVSAAVALCADAARRPDAPPRAIGESCKAGREARVRGSKRGTLETGCGNEIDPHFADPATLPLGLNDYVYTLKK